MVKKIPYGTVDIRNPHFCISWKNSNVNGNYELIMVLSTAPDVEKMKLCLLVHDIKYERAIKEIQEEVVYYLYKLKNPDPVSYLVYHATTLANVYSNVHFIFIEKINDKNLLYYIKTRSKQIGVYYINFVSELEKKYAIIAVKVLRNRACGRSFISDKEHFNKKLFELYDLILEKMPAVDDFKIETSFTIIEFSKWLADLDLHSFCIILSYLKKIKLIKLADVEDYLKFFYLNRK